MSRKIQIIEISAPTVFRTSRPERFTLNGFVCPECQGNGWHWSPDGKDYVKVSCSICGGSGEVCAEVTVNWKKQEVGK